MNSYEISEFFFLYIKVSDFGTWKQASLILIHAVLYFISIYNRDSKIVDFDGMFFFSLVFNLDKFNEMGLQFAQTSITECGYKKKKKQYKSLSVLNLLL